jgi:hypothetical protein
LTAIDLIYKWVKNIPVLGNLGSQEHQKSAPKMLSLLSGGGVDPGSLESINEDDAFSGGCTPKPLATILTYRDGFLFYGISELPGPNFAPRTYANPFATVPSTALVGLCTGDEAQVNSTDQYTQFEA